MHPTRGLVTLLLLILLPATFTVWFVAPVRGATLLVPSQYATIQAAVNAARSGDIIQVAAGTYPENVAVTETVTIIGENALTTIVDGRGQNVVFNIQADNVELRQLTIRNGGNRYPGVNVFYLYSGAKIRNNRIIDNAVGVVVTESGSHLVENNVLMNNSMYGIDSTGFSSGNTFRNNTISDSAYGMELSDTSNSQVVLNTISHVSYGVFAPYSNNNNVSANTFSDSSWSIYFVYSNSNVVGYNVVLNGSLGIEVLNSQDNLVINNTLSGSSYGIYLGNCGANTVSGNRISGYDWGIELYGSTGSTIKENWVKDNTWGFYIVANSRTNYIYHNDIITNVKQAYQDPTSSPNTWNTPTTPFQGNYWSDYRGSDTNGDGIGDTFIPWAGVDWYPLIQPLGVNPDIAVISVLPYWSGTYVGLSINITVVAKNLGTTTETFNVTCYYNQSVIETRNVAGLAPAANATLIFTWNTTGVALGRYVISANATIVPMETNTGNNSLSDGTIHVKKPGDINGDGKVDIQDGVLLSLNYGRPANEFPDGDVNGDGEINVLDAIVIATNWTA